MKMNCGFLLAAMLSTGLLAQEKTNAPSDTPTAVSGPGAGTSNAAALPNPNPSESGLAPASTNLRSTSAQAEPRTTPLTPGPAIVTATHVNVRGQPKLNSEIVTQLNKGQEVTVLEEIRLEHSAPDEPSAWAKILLPQGVNVWVFKSYIQPTNLTVIPRRLNLRSGPGENYSVLGRIQRGERVGQIEIKGDWMEIEAPANAYAFMAAEYLANKPEQATLVAATEPSPPTNTVGETAATEIAPTNNPPVVEAPGASNIVAQFAGTTNELAVADTNAQPPAIEEPPPKRIVHREGFVRGTFSIQAPTQFELVSADTGKVVDYLYTTSTNLDLSRYKGLRIIVSGEEGLDERWRNTPVITIRRIQVLE